ncbi:MAG: hypothetical protein HY315_06845 [Acidobacteria bacterium]|nr:hypothetical protein [Acidobacteriota bacterium]
MMKKSVVLALAALTVLLCWTASWIGKSNRAGLALAQATARPAERRTVIIKRDPIRVISNPYPTYRAVAIDEERGELFLGNDNRGSKWGSSIDTYRVEFGPMPVDVVREPLRRIAGPKTGLGGVCTLAVSPDFKEIYYVEDEGAGVVAFPIDGNGDIEPSREFTDSHGTFGLFFDPKFQELYITVQHVNRVAVYPRTAQVGNDPLRFIQGPATELADPHGIYVDSEKNEIYVVNHGNWRHTEPGEIWESSPSVVPPELQHKLKSIADIRRPLTPSTGKFLPPSITVYSSRANGDARPLRVIQGPKTGMRLPSGIFLDSASNQLVLANTVDDSILFFDATASGDVAPVRVLRGPETRLSGPTTSVIDKKRDELWVANYNNHTATVYPRTAQGNVAPRRTIRSAPLGTVPMGLGNFGTITYNPKRKEILVPN